LDDQAVTRAPDAIKIDVRGCRLAGEAFAFRIGRRRQNLGQGFGVGSEMRNDPK
jgi:hypothetical protein